MCRLFAPLLTLVLAVSFASAVKAANLDFTVVNSTGYQIDNIYVSEASSSSWGRDVMGRDTLGVNETVDIEFDQNGKTCRWDLMVRYNDGDEATWRNLNLCNISKVTLFWNAKTQKTTAKTE